jgi:ribosomal protein S18 acetylase RimI-like enzyme
MELTTLAAAGPPLWGLDEEAVRFVEIHETRAHALGGRTMRDLGDGVLLFAARDRDPFFNRVAAVRWPDDEDAFDHRLAEVITLFAALDRRPHVWTSPAFSRPADIAARLAGHGFLDTDGGYVMILVRPPGDAPDLPPGVVVERLDGGPGVTVRGSILTDISRVLARSFGVDGEQLEAVEAETAEAFASPDFHVCLVRSRGEAVAVGKRYSFDGATYLSSIGTVPGQRGRGLGFLVTDALVRDGLAAGSEVVYLGVHTHNDRAIAVYRRVGMEVLGGRSGDYLLV